MTADDPRVRLTRLADARIARRLDDDDSAAARAPTSAAAARWPAPGDRVFDTITGLEGTVRSVDQPISTRVPIVRVQFDDGRLEPRFADLVVARPVPPAARV